MSEKKLPTIRDTSDLFQRDVRERVRGVQAKLEEHTEHLDTLASAPDVTGATGGNAALQSLLSVLASLGLITDKTT